MPSLNQARAERRRAIIAGRVRVRGMPPHFWLWLLIGLGVFGIVYWWWAARELATQKSAVMAKQRAVAAMLGPRIMPFREKVEGWVVQLARGPWPEDQISEAARAALARHATGVYLRLPRHDALERKGIAEAAVRSLHDGFTSCFFVREGEADPRHGAPCQALADCEPGLLCNEWDVCAPPPRPYNLRLAYRALRVLSPEWTDELHEAPSDLAVRVQERDLDAVTRNDVPVSIELLTRAKYLTVVLDEEAASAAADPPSGDADADAELETDEQRLQRLPHWARVGIWDLRSGENLAKVRRRAEGRVVSVSAPRNASRASTAAQQRQVNSCALALAVRGALGRASGAVSPSATDTPAPRAGAGTENDE